MYANLQRIIFTAKLFKEKDEWKSGLLKLAKSTVIRLPRLWQSAFFLLGYTREQICLGGTNKLFWKHARQYLNEDFIDRMVAYTPYGLKEGPFKQYQTVNFLEKNIEGINGDDIEPQCGMHMSKLHKWLVLCLRTRKDEITYRKANRQKAIQQREELIKREQERQARQAQELIEAEGKYIEEHKEEIELAQKWEADQNGGGQDDDYGDENDEDGASAMDTRRQERPEMPVFNKEEFLKKWLEENPIIDIPPEYVPEIDADWELTEEEEQRLVSTFMGSKSD